MSIEANDDKPIVLSTNGAERMRVNATGVGIGTTAPAQKLDVSGVVQIRAASAPTTDSNFRLWSEAGVGANIDSWNIKFNTGQGGTRTNIMYLSYNGNVGIGTTAPGAKLSVESAANSNAIALTGAGTGSQAISMANTGASTQIGINGSTAGAVFTGSLAYAQYMFTQYNGVATPAIQFAPNATVAMTIQANGTVLTPNQPLVYLNGNAATVAGAATMTAFTAEIQKGGMTWNATNGRVTVPVAGYYRIDLKTYHYTASCRTHIYINGAVRSLCHSAGATADQTRMQYVIVLLAVNDYITFTHTAQVYMGVNHTQASCYLMG
jgi:hypothetical protein